MSDFTAQMAIDAVQTFLADGDAVEIKRFIGGDSNNAEMGIPAIVDWDAEVNGSTARPHVREARPSDGFGKREPAHCVVELLASQAAGDGDRFAVLHGDRIVLVNFVRELGADAALKSVLCCEPGNRTTKTSRLRR